MKQRQVAQHRCGSVSLRGVRRKRGLADLLTGVSASAAALALSFAPQQARAQAVNGTPTVVFGANAPTRTTTSDSFNVVAGEALIDWAVTDPSVFLNTGTTLSFNGSEGPYTVLNRVVSAPSLASTLALNGRVQSDSAGKIWFYNPGGWAVGAGAVIDVGSLLLTASPVTVDDFDPGNPGASRFLGDNGEIRLGQATVAGASITVDPLANITTRGDASYIALVAPRVVQAGTVTVGGSAAYVGAEAADITINNGLFDIAVTAGTTDPNGVVHTGTTTGPSSFGSTPRTQFLVAVGKNDAMTMLVRGQLGYNAASSAGFVEGRIVLSSGQGIASNDPSAQGTGRSSISISDAEFRNDLTAAASDRIDVSVATAGESVSVDGFASLSAGNGVGVSVSGNDSEFLVLGDLSLAASNGATGGAITIDLSSGGGLLAENLIANADGIGARLVDEETGELVPGAVGEAARGGSVALTATDATLQVSGATFFSADARGGIGGASAGSATAGTVSLTASNSTVLLGEGGVTLFARALRANDGGRLFLSGTTGAASTGGSATLDLSGDSSQGAIVLDNSAAASIGLTAAPQAASTGALALRLASGTFSASSIAMNSIVESDSGGAATGGASTLTVTGANVTLNEGISLFGQVTGDIPTTVGGAGSASLIVNGGGSLSAADISLTRESIGTVGGKVATGGNVTLEVSDGGSLFASSVVQLRADGRGALTSAGPGGSGTGGTIAITVDDGTLSAGSLLSARALGTPGGSFSGVVNGETGRGGAISLSLGGANGSIFAPTIELSAPGTAFFGEGSLGGTAGIGGSVDVTVDGGSLDGNGLFLSAVGAGGDGSTVGEEQIPQAGGTGRGGTVGLTVNGGSLRTDAVALDANGEGGFGASSFGGTAPAGRGGDAFGGTATLDLTGGTLATDNLSVTAGANVPEFVSFGEGFFSVNYYGAGGYAFGDGGVAGAGGTGTGGTSAITVGGGALTSRSGSSGSGASPLAITLDSTGYGGNGGSTGGGSGIGSTKGDGGTGIGGSSTIELLGGSADFESLLAIASGLGGVAGFEEVASEGFARAPVPTGTSLGADGGDGRGGSAVVTIAMDLDAFADTGAQRLVIVDAVGIGGDAADGDVAGNGGNGFGGNATLEIDGATVSLIDPSVEATGQGGFGSLSRLSNPGGDGGAGFGGNATLSLSNGANFNLIGGALLAEGTGQDGRTGSDGGGNAAPGNGGKGGDAQGGTASLLLSGGSTLDFQSGEFGTLAMDVTGRAGNGGLGGSDIFFEGNSFGNGGAGGAGAGGGIVVEATDTTIDLGFASFNADGFGGDGGGRVTDESGVAGEFSIGGDGGEAQGGSVRLTAIGQDALVTFSSLDISATGIAGAGAAGQGIDATTFAGARGGNGLAAAGGSIMLEAQSGGALTARTADSSANPGLVSLEASGFAGIGGEGANGATNPVTGVGGAGGDGGNSGQGNGGSISLVANGGTITLGELRVNANGVGRFGASGGAGGAGMVPPNSPPMTPPASSGAGGAFGIGGGGVGGVGGSVELSALTNEGGTAGGLSLGATEIDVTGRMTFFDFSVQSVGGKVSIIDRVDDSNGGVRFGSLGIDASGDTTFEPFSVTIESNDRPIVVDGDLSIAAAGDVLIPTTGTGGLDIGGLLEIESFGTVQIDDDFCGSECPTEPTISADSAISIIAPGGNVLLIGASTLDSGGTITIDAGGSITGGPGSGYTTPGALNLTARGDIAVRNAAVGTLSAKAGRFLVDLGEGLQEERFEARDLTLGEDEGGGRIVTNFDFTGLAGGDLTITPGAEVSSGFGLSLTSGDNIVIGSGASLNANTTGSSEPSSLLLDAGGLVTVVEPVVGEVASLIVDNGATIDGGTGSVQLIGGAIDARGATIAGSDVIVGVRNAPSSEITQSDDNDLLTAPCLEGDICLGSVTATGQVSIGQDDDTPVRFLGTGNITGESVAITSRDTLTFGAATVPLTASAGGAITLQSQDANVELLGGATLSGGSVDVAAGGSLIGTGNLVSTGDVGITVGDSIAANSIVAAGQLTGFGQTGGEPEGLFSLPGDFTVTTLRLGADAAISAGGDIVVGSATLGGNDLDFDAGGLVSLGSTAQVGDIALSGNRALFGTLLAGGDIAIDAETSVTGDSATSGGALSISGTTIGAGNLRSRGAMALTSSGATTIGSATSGAGLAINSGPLTFGTLASTGATAIDAASVAGDTITAGSNLSVISAAEIDVGQAMAGTSLVFDGATITSTSLASGGNATLTAGTIDVGSIVSGGGIDVTGETVMLGSTQSSGLTKVGAGTLTLSSADADGGLELAVDGAATLGRATSGAQIAILAGDLSFDSLTSAGATSVEAASVAGGDIDAGSSLAVTSDGAIGLGSATAGTTLTLEGASIAANALTSGGNAMLTAGTVDVGSIVSGEGIDVAGGTVALGSTQSTGLTKVGAGTLTLSSADADGGLELAVEGAATLGNATSGAQIAILAGDLSFDSLTSTGATSVTATSVAGGDIDAGSSLAVTSDGAIGLGSATAGTTLTLDGASIAATALTSDGDSTLTAGTVDVGSIVSGEGIDVAGGTVALGSTQSTGLTKVGAGTLTLSSADADGGLELAVDGAATLGTVQSGAGVSATAGDLSFTRITASGDIAATVTTIAGGDATSTAGAVSLSSTGATSVGQLRAGTDVNVDASALTFAGIEAARDVRIDVSTLNGTTIAAGRDLTIRSVSSLTFGTIGAGRDVSLSSSNGALTVTTDLNAGGTASLDADAIAVQAAGDLRVNRASASNGNIAIVTDGLLRVDSATAIGDITLTSTANSLIVGGAVAGETPNVGTALTAETTTSPAAVGAGAIVLGAASDITLLGTVDANTSLAATAGRLIDQRALAVGKTVTYRSADLALGQGANLGQSNFTTAIGLTNTGSAGAILGDIAETTPGYRIDNAEFGRIHSGGDLSLAGGSSLSVGTLSASAASGSGGVANGNIGANGTLALATSGELGVGGDFALANAGGNTLNLTSGGALFVDAGSGSVRLVEGSASGGSLAVSAGSIMALTSTARAAISGLDTRALDQRLSMNDGVSADRTLLQAGAITLSSNGAILIQNTSPGISFDERRGFVADSLTLITRGETSGSPTGGTGSPTSGLADIVINGTVAGTTGLTALRAVEIDGSFSDFSTINGCRIVSASCGNPAIDPIRDLIEEEVEVGTTLENTADGFGQSPLITIDRIEPAGFETVIDEPVTGAGNDDFLVPEAGAGDEVCTAEDQTKCDKPPAG